MRLEVNFSKLEQAILLMGVEPISLTLNVDSQPLAEIDLKLDEGIELNLSEVESEGGLLSFEGRQVLLYIQDHGGSIAKALEHGSDGRRFHVADCRTLKEMKEKGRYERYVVTNNLDEEFFITGKDWKTREIKEGYTNLLVCQNCLKSLNYKGAAQGMTSVISKNFNIVEFFETYSSFFSYLPRRKAGNSEDEEYTSDWSLVAGRYKAEKNLTCESCGVDLSSNKNLLHVHHKNGVKSDNSILNLMSLCACCHREQPNHGHMFVKHQDTKVINSLRRQQKLLGKDDWDEVLSLCDPSMKGLVMSIKDNGIPVPEVGYDIQDDSESVISSLELAWPESRVGVAISVEDKAIAVAAGWSVFEMIEVLGSTDDFTSLIVDDVIPF